MGSHWARAERQRVCEILRELGPAAPTLCGDWLTQDLAAHLVMREARPDGAAGIAFSPLSGRTEKLQRKYATRDFGELVDAIESGPLPLSPFRFPGADEILNTTEYFVHHEDIRRAQEGWQPRDLPAEFRDALWRIVKSRAPVLMRSAPVGVELVRSDTQGNPRVQIGRSPAAVQLSAPAAELLLYAFGRKEHAKVAVTGEPSAIEAVARADFSV